MTKSTLAEWGQHKADIGPTWGNTGPFGRRPVTARHAIWGRAMRRRPPPHAQANPAMHKASDAGHIGPHGMRRWLIFEQCSMCIKHRKYRQKWPWEELVWGKGRNPKTATHHLQMDLFNDFLIVFEVTFFNVKIEARAKNIVNTVKK